MVLSAGSWAQAQAQPEGPSAGRVPGIGQTRSLDAPTVRSIDVTGASAIRAQDVASVVSAIVLGKIGDAATIRDATKAAIDLYRSRGFPVAQVSSAEVTSDGVLHVTLAEGTIRRVVIRGNRKTRLSTIFRALSMRPGEVYSEIRARSDRNRLARLGIFDDVIIAAQAPGTEDLNVPPISSASSKGDDLRIPPDLNPGATPNDSDSRDNPAGNASGSGTNPPDAPPSPNASPVDINDVLPINVSDDQVGQVDLVVRVKEHSTFNIAATVGYADAVGPVGFVALSELNTAGTAQRIDVAWQRISESYLNSDGSIARQDSRQALDFLYEKPALNTKATSFSLSVYDKNTVFLPYFAGQDQTFRTFEKRAGATARIGKAIGANVTGYATLRRADVAYDEFANFYTGPLPPQYLIDTSAGRIGAVGVELVADDRDVVDNPRRGYLDSIRYEDAGDILGGNRFFSQTTADLRSYSPVNDAKDGPVFAVRLLAGYTNGVAPLSEFYFLGGYELLRGYDLYSIYGDRMLLGTAELRARLSQGLQGVLFVDEGGAWLPGDSVEARDLRGDGGIGVRFLSPIGPIRFDAAYGSALKTYVTLGQSF